MCVYVCECVYVRGGSRKALRGGGGLKEKKVPELLVGLAKMLTRQLENHFSVDSLLFGNCSIFSNHEWIKLDQYRLTKAPFII